MPVYYVATRARYELVEAHSEQEARERGQAKLGCDARHILVVRLATADEVELAGWHRQMRA